MKMWIKTSEYNSNNRKYFCSKHPEKSHFYVEMANLHIYLKTISIKSKSIGLQIK